MSGYPGGGGYPGSGYPGSARPPQGGGGGYPGGGSGGYPGGGGGYPGGGGGYPGSSAPPPNAPGYSGGAPPPRQQGYPQGSAPNQSGGYPGYQGGGAPPPQQSGYGYPSAGQQVDPNVAGWFRAVDQDGSGQITASELQRALVNGNWSNFSEEACRMMIDIFDKNKSGTIDLNEFQALFNYINQWKAVFQSFDTDRSGKIEQNELTQAFQQMGYRFSPTFVQNLLAKYDPRNRRLTLDNFIVACVQIKRLTDSFRNRDREMRGQATLQYEDFVGLALGAHN